MVVRRLTRAGRFLLGVLLGALAACSSEVAYQAASSDTPPITSTALCEPLCAALQYYVEQDAKSWGAQGWVHVIDAATDSDCVASCMANTYAVHADAPTLVSANRVMATNERGVLWKARVRSMAPDNAEVVVSCMRIATEFRATVFLKRDSERWVVVRGFVDLDA